MGLLDVLNGIQNGPRGAPQPTPGGGGGGGMSPMTMAILGLLAYKAVKGLSGGQPAPAGAGRPVSPPPGGTVAAGAPGGGGLGDLLGGLFGGAPGGARPGAGPGAAPGGLGDLLGGLFGGAPSGARPDAGPGSPPGGLGDLLGGLFGGAPGGARPGAGPGSPPGGLGGLLGGAAAGGLLSGGLASIIKDLQNSGQGTAASSWVGTGPNHEINPDDLGAALGKDTLDTLTRQTGMRRDDLLEGLSQYLPGVVDHLTPNGRLPTEHEAARMV
jgi:uncharacterized protein YidB (DUF937 family)